MATNLIVRNVDDGDRSIVERNRRRAMAAAPRPSIAPFLKAALLQPRKRSFNEVLASMPNVGPDSDFEFEIGASNVSRRYECAQ